MDWWSVTGNTVFDFYFGLVSFFAFSGWTVGIIISTIKRVIR